MKGKSIVILLFVWNLGYLVLTSFPVMAVADNPSPPASPVKLIFIHHSSGENWLADTNDEQTEQGGGLGTALRDNNYFVSDTNYGWGPDGIGDNTDFGHWYNWFLGPNRDQIMAAVYTESGQHPKFSSGYSRMSTDPGSENQIIMFKSCFPNSGLSGSADDPATTGTNPLFGQSSDSEYHTIANAKGVYQSLLTYFANHTDKLFIAVTAPPMSRYESGNDDTKAANARAFNNWLVNDWLDDYPYSNVAVFDFYNVLTSNGGDKNTNDAGQETGNHHRWYNGQQQHIQTVDNNHSAYAYYEHPDWSDSHPTGAGNIKATTEFVPLLNYWYQRWKSGSSETTYANRLYYPHVASDTNWETEIGLIDTGSSNGVTGQFKAYSDTGSVVCTKTVTLNSHGRQALIVSDTFCSPSSIGYIVFETNADPSEYVGYVKFYTHSGQYRVAAPAVSRINSGPVYVSHIDSSNDYWTGISLVNTTDSAKTLTIAFSDTTVKTVSLDENGHKAFTVASLFNNTSQPGITSAIIQNASGVIGLELFGSSTTSGNKYLSGILLRDEGLADMVYPHVASDDWWTGICAYNTATTPATLTITPYTSAGVKLTHQDLIINGNSKYIGTISSLGLPSETGWIHIAPSNPVIGFELFGTNNGNQLAGYTGAETNSSKGIFPKLETDGWTGIAFVNPTGGSITVTLTAYDDAGNGVASQDIVLSGYEKRVDLAENLFTGSTISSATYIGYTATGPIVGFQLNGSSNGMMLDALPGL